MSFPKHFYLLTAGLFLFYACGNNKQEEKSPKNSDNSNPVSSTETVENTSSDGDYYFTGLIDHKYAVCLHLAIKGKTGEGKYFYNSQKRELDLSGEINGTNLELDEMVKGKVTGHFTGSIYGSDSATGSWKSPKGKVLSFVLYKSDAKKYVQQIGNEESIKVDPQQLRAFTAKFRSMRFPFRYRPVSEEDPGIEEFTPEEIKTYAMSDYDPETTYGYHYYYGVTYQSRNYTALIFTEDYYPGAFGVHNASLVMMTFSANGELIDKVYLGCDCLDTNMGTNDYYATNDQFVFTENQITVESEYTHATLIEEDSSETKPFEEKQQKTSTIIVSPDGKIGATGY